MSKKENKIKGHGYLRKTKLGLASGIVLGATLFVGAGVVSADETTAPSNGNVATAQTNDTKEVVVDNDLTKVAEEAKKTGLQVDKEPTKNIGTANTEAEAEALQKKAEAEVDAQKKTIQEAQKKFDEENKAVDERLENLKKLLHDNRTYPQIVSAFNYTADNDYLGGKAKIGEINSSKGTVDYLNVKSDKLDINIDNTRPDELNKVYDLGKTDKPKETLVSFNENPSGQLLTNHPNSPITDKYHEKVIPVFVSPNETVTYRVEYADDSEMAKMGIKYREVKFTLKSTGTNNKDDKVIAMLSPYGNHNFSGGFAFRWEGKDNVNGQPFEVENGYNYLDKNGKVIDKKTLGQQWLNKLTLKGAIVDTSFFPDAPTTFTDDDKGDGKVYKDDEHTREAGGEYFYKAIRKFKPNPLTWGGVSMTSINASKPKENDGSRYNKKQSEKVAYHLVSYNVNKPKATNNADKLKKGSIVQVFVDEGGKEIAPKTNTGEKPVDETVKLTHPNEIKFEGKTYIFTKQDKVDPTKIPNGSETITYTYKLKEEPKPVPTPTPTPTPTPAPTPTPVEKPTTIHIDGNTGKEIAPKEDGTKPFKNIDGYEPAPKDSKNVVDPKGKTVRVYNIIKKGNVEVRYVKDDASKTVLKEPVADTVGAKVGSDYDTTDHKPKTITKDGVTYELVRTEGAEKGKVVEGKTVVTYVYRQSVEPTTVHVDEDGNRVAPPEKGTKPFKNIDGFEPSPKNPKNVENPKGETVRVYKAVKGDVEVRYVKDDKERTPLKEPVADTTQAKVGTKYDTTDHKPVTITKDGVTYELVRTEGTEKGNVAKGKTVVTYVYREVQKPITIHVDKDGNPVAPKEDGTKPFKEIEGYKPAPKDPKNVEDPKGVTVRVYEKANPEAPQEAPKTPQKPEAPKPTAQANVTATLPNTGSEASTALAIAGMGILGLSALAYKKKED